jgi:hypothetical protein
MSATGSWMAIVDTPTGPANIRLELMNVTIDGDTLTGTAKPNFFPAEPMTATRL